MTSLALHLPPAPVFNVEADGNHISVTSAEYFPNIENGVGGILLRTKITLRQISKISGLKD